MRVSKPFCAGLLKLAALIIGINLGYWLWDYIIIPFRNPWGIAGYLANIGYNPLNSVARFLAVIGLPCLILIAIWPVIRWLDRGRQSAETPSPRASRGWLAATTIIILAMSLLVQLVPLGNSRDHPTLDMFHDGEGLSAEMSYAVGLKPYRDFLFVHGPFQDPIRPQLAFDLWGRAISSMRTAEILLALVSSIMLFGLILALAWPDPLAALVMTTLVVAIHFLPLEGGIVGTAGMPARDITTLGFLLVTLALYRGWLKDRLTARKLFGLSLAWGLLGAGSYAYSIDRGFYLNAVYALLAISLFWAAFYRTKLARPFIAGNLAGMVLAAGLIALSVRGAVIDFARYTFWIMPRYKELSDGLPYEIKVPALRYTLIFVAFNLAFLVERFLTLETRLGSYIIAAKEFIRRYFIELALVLVSLAFWRSALGRSDIGHVAYIVFPTYIATIYIAVKHYLSSWLSRPPVRRILAPFVLAAGVVWVIGQTRVVADRGFSNILPVGIPDSALVPRTYQPAIDYLKSNLGPRDSFVTMTSEGAWYYLVGKPSPTRFPVVWFAQPPFYQDQMVTQMEQKRPKFVIYRNQSPADDIDGVSNQERLPRVFAYIRAHYHPDRKINDHELWVRS